MTNMHHIIDRVTLLQFFVCSCSYFSKLLIDFPPKCSVAIRVRKCQQWWFSLSPQSVFITQTSKSRGRDFSKNSR